MGRGLEEDLYGSLYDNIFLRGHIGMSPIFFKRVIPIKALSLLKRVVTSVQSEFCFPADEERPVDQDKQQFVPGYLALFL